MSNAKRVLEALGDRAQQVGGRIIVRHEGRNCDVLTPSGDLTEFGETLLSDKPARKNGRAKPKSPAPSADIADDMRDMLDQIGDAEEE
ncbi:MAG: hypothetical protein WC972_12795 [Trueperaceae bacterium]